VITYAAVSTLEVEVKLKVREITPIPARMTGIGARLVHPREFEDNCLYDFPDRALLGRGAMLRVRVAGASAFLTYKDGGRSEGGVKIREEVETRLEASEATTLTEIIRRLGMQVVFRYQKYRTAWRVDGLHAMLDETPIGAYIELEGERDAIDRVATSLGYSSQDYIASSYRDLYMTSLSRKPGPVDRMLFPDHQRDLG
jgi:adenylate cyclase, class 2